MGDKEEEATKGWHATRLLDSRVSREEEVIFSHFLSKALEYFHPEFFYVIHQFNQILFWYKDI